ncbi:MAG: hypothetical protein ACR2OZ_18545 [Verrucomicrobiales bacterium]
MRLLVAARFTTELKELFYQVKQPYFAEQLLQPVFVWGIGLGVLLLVIAHFWKEARLKVVALILLGAAGFAIFPYLKTRQRAIAHAAGRATPSRNVTELRVQTKWVFVGIGSFALATLILGNKPRLGPILTFSTMIGGLATTAFAIWLDAKDAGVMHTTTKPQAVARQGVYR